MRDNFLLTVKADGTEVLWIRRGLIPSATVCELAALFDAAEVAIGSPRTGVVPAG